MSTYLLPAVDGYTRDQQKRYRPSRCSSCWSGTVVVAWVLVGLPPGSEDRRPRAVPRWRCTKEECGETFEWQPGRAAPAASYPG